MTDEIRRPSFFECWLDDIKLEYRKHGWHGVPPWWLIILVGGGAAGAFLVPAEFWSRDKWDVSTAVYGAILTFNALVLAVSWGAFSKIFESACAPGFSAYLRERGLLVFYIYYIDYVHLAQLVAVAASAVGLLSVVIDLLPEMWERVLFGAVVGLSAYAMKQAAGTVTAMHDIVWYRSIYDAHQLAASGGNVVPLVRNGG